MRDQIQEAAAFTTQDGTTSGVNMQVSQQQKSWDGGTFQFFVLVLITFPFLSLLIESTIPVKEANSGDAFINTVLTLS
jgi:hypothetical protein